MRILNLCIVFNAFVLVPLPAHAVVIETILVGNPGNAADTEIMTDGTTGYGDVAYEYRIGKYEVTKAQYTEFLNAVNPTGESLNGVHKLDLYESGFSTGFNGIGGGIDFNAAAPNGSKYSVRPGYENHPANWVTWYAAIRFANWLHNGQGSGDTETGAYTLGPFGQFGSDPINGNSITRNPGAKWFLPSEDEWYKAAYHKNDGATGNYWNYPTRSDSVPTAEIPPGGVNSANYSDVVANFTPVGSYPLSPSPYGTFDQGGNADEWNEALLAEPDIDFPNVTVYYRGIRGSSMYYLPGNDGSPMAASSRPATGCDGGNPGCHRLAGGFRVASIANPVPEPGTRLLLAAGTTIIALGRWRSRLSAVICAVVLVPTAAQAVVIDTVLVGNPGNAADTEIMSDGTTGYGAVPYEYRIGKYEVTNAQYAEFLNTKDPTGIDTLDLYLPSFCDRVQCGINYNAAAADGAKYVVKPARGNHPVTYVTWYQAIRFANWLHNGQGSGDTETGAYTLGPLSDSGGDPLNGKDTTRNVGARWFLPSENEWYKAAYHKNDGVTGNYWDYPMGSDAAPTAAISPGGVNSANFNDVLGDVSPVGAYSLAPGPYGTFDQAGNVDEWNEALLNFGSHFTQVTRGHRGVGWFGGGTDVTEFLAAAHRPASECDGGGNINCGSFARGFRVAAIPSPVPEPSAWLLVLSGILAWVAHHNRSIRMSHSSVA